MVHEDPILATWSSVTNTNQFFSIMPDGCRDLILKQKPGSPKRFFVSRLMSTPKRIFAKKGEIFIGVRLKPSAVVAVHRLNDLPPPSSIQRLIELARYAASVSVGVSDMMGCLEVTCQRCQRLGRKPAHVAASRHKDNGADSRLLAPAGPGAKGCPAYLGRGAVA
jgi:hypothetical protein